MQRREIELNDELTIAQRRTEDLERQIAEKDKLIGSLKRERNQHKDMVVDLGAQNEELRKSKVITPAEEAEFSRLRGKYAEYKGQVDTLALWLRNNKPEDLGKHSGKGIAAIIIGYLEGGTNEK